MLIRDKKKLYTYRGNLGIGIGKVYGRGLSVVSRSLQGGRYRGGNIFNMMPKRISTAFTDAGKTIYEAKKDDVKKFLKNNTDSIVGNIIEKAIENTPKPVSKTIANNSDLISGVSKKFISDLLEGKGMKHKKKRLSRKRIKGSGLTILK